MAAVHGDRDALVVQPGQAVAPGLVSAVEKAYHEHTFVRSLQDWSRWLSSVSRMNQREVVICMRMVADTTIHSRKRGIWHCVQAMRTFVRLSVHLQFEDECRKMRSSFDLVMKSHWLCCRAGGMDPDDWWTVQWVWFGRFCFCFSLFVFCFEF